MNDAQSYRLWIAGKPMRHTANIETAYRAGHSAGASELANAVRLLRQVNWLYVDTGDMAFKEDVKEFILRVDPNNAAHQRYMRPKPRTQKLTGAQMDQRIEDLKKSGQR